ncbi:MAG TPA: AAA family ATPase [Candidatus Dormibacteraeota bacterium]|nr:AAA family ATPase [Candidatus Dormibacteraeota bacterium]
MALDLTTPEARAKALEHETNVQRIKEQARRSVRAETALDQHPRAGLVFDGEEDLRPTEYLVDGVIPAEGAGMLFGETDVGKTTVALSVAIHVVAKLPWLGHAVLGGTVYFIESEGGRAFALRKHAAKGAAGCGDGRKLPFASLPFVTTYEPLGFGPDTDVAIAVSNAETIRRAVAERGLPPIRLVVVDTLAQNIAGDADNNEEMSAFLRAFRAFLKALSDEPVFGLLIHHPGHKDKERGRGAYSLEADLDLVMSLEGAPEALTLLCKRMRNDSRFAPILLRLERRTITMDGEPLRDCRGREQTALVVLPRGADARSGAAVDPIERAVLAALPDHPGKAGVQAYLVPKVASLLGRSVGKDTVAAKCFTLEKKGLAESAPGRQKDSLAWGKAKRKAEPEDEDR